MSTLLIIIIVSLLAMFADPVVAMVIIYVVVGGVVAIFHGCVGYEEDNYRAMREHFRKEFEDL